MLSGSGARPTASIKFVLVMLGRLMWGSTCRGTWKDEKFKAYNFNALGQPTAGGHLHPLLKVSDTHPSDAFLRHVLAQAFFLLRLYPALADDTGICQIHWTSGHKDLSTRLQISDLISACKVLKKHWIIQCCCRSERSSGRSSHRWASRRCQPMPLWKAGARLPWPSPNH